MGAAVPTQVLPFHFDVSRIKLAWADALVRASLSGSWNGANAHGGGLAQVGGGAGDGGDGGGDGRRGPTWPARWAAIKLSSSKLLRMTLMCEFGDVENKGLRVCGRLKSLHSVCAKMLRKNETPIPRRPPIPLRRRRRPGAASKSSGRRSPGGPMYSRTRSNSVSRRGGWWATRPR